MKRLTSPRRLALVLALACAGIAPAASADTINAWVKGAKQGVLKGEEVVKGREGSTRVLRLQHGLALPHDAANRPTGQRQHRMFVFAHPNGAMATQLFTAAVNNENLSEVIVQVWATNLRAAPAQGQALITTIKLTNARVIDLNLNATRTTGSETEVLQEVSLGYQRIEITDHLTNTVTVDELDPRM